jgi:hypothetical protein
LLVVSTNVNIVGTNSFEAQHNQSSLVTTYPRALCSLRRQCHTQRYSLNRKQRFEEEGKQRFEEYLKTKGGTIGRVFEDTLDKKFEGCLKRNLGW